MATQRHSHLPWHSLSRLTISLIPVALLTGCAMSSTAPPAVNVTPAAISGKVFGGQQPVAGSTVTAWASGSGAIPVLAKSAAIYNSPATLLATTTTDSSGNFAFSSNAYTCPTATTQVYLVASGGDPGVGSGPNTAITLAAGLGNCSSARTATVNINEVSTVATAFALAQFFTPAGGGSPDFFSGPTDTNSFALANSSTIPTLISLPNGTVNPNSSAITIESAKIYTIANILAACVNSATASSACSSLFASTAPSGGATPTNTLEAAVNMALYPYQNVSTLFGLITPAAPFIGLSTAPNDFTIAVSYTTPNLGLSVASGTSSNIDIDATGNIWFPSNASGKVGLAYFNPSSNTFSGPLGGAIPQAPITQPQYVSIDLNSDVFLTDQNSGNVIAVDALSTSQYGYFNITALNGGTITGGPISTDYDNTLYLILNEAGFSPDLAEINATRTALSNSGSFSYNPTSLAASYGFDDGYYDVAAATSAPSSPCNLEDTEVDNFTYLDSANYVDASTAGNCSSGGVAITSGDYDYVSVASTANQICSANYGDCFAPSVPLSAPQSIATDGVGQLWIANSANGSISTLNGTYGLPTDYGVTSPVAYLHNSANGATMTQPYGLAIDGAGNVWVSNAGCVTTGFACTPGAFVLSELIGAAAPTITPLSAQLGGAFSGLAPSTVRSPSTTPHIKRPAHSRSQAQPSQSQPTIPAILRRN
jgi:hypothetical protein